MGEECPLPGRGIFQRILLVSLQWTGGLARGDTPLADGPRHCGQLSGVAVQVAMSAWLAKAERTGRQPRTSRKRGIMLMHCVPLMGGVSKAAAGNFQLQAPMSR